MRPWHLFAAALLASSLLFAADPEPTDEEVSPVQAPADDEAAAADDASSDNTAAAEDERDDVPTGERVDVGDVEGVFVPSEEISADSALSFPADI